MPRPCGHSHYLSSATRFVVAASRRPTRSIQQSRKTHSRGLYRWKDISPISQATFRPSHPFPVFLKNHGNNVSTKTGSPRKQCLHQNETPTPKAPSSLSNGQDVPPLKSRHRLSRCPTHLHACFRLTCSTLHENRGQRVIHQLRRLREPRVNGPNWYNAISL